MYFVYARMGANIGDTLLHIYICIYIYMNRVMTQSHMVNDGVHADQL